MESSTVPTSSYMNFQSTKSYLKAPHRHSSTQLTDILSKNEWLKHLNFELLHFHLLVPAYLVLWTNTTVRTDWTLTMQTQIQTQTTKNLPNHDTLNTNLHNQQN